MLLYILNKCVVRSTFQTARLNEAANYLPDKPKSGQKKIGQNLIYQVCPIR